MALRPPVSNGGSSVDSFSTAEVMTNKVWTDGKAVYRKVVALGNLPSASTKSVAHGIVGATNYIAISGYAFNGSNTWNNLPMALPTTTDAVGLQVNGANIAVYTGANFWSAWTGIAVVEYTK